jgi:uncharacterized protein involved in response to NO
MYVLMQIGVIARFAATLTPGQMRDVALVIAAASWAAAFMTYLWVYGPYLCKARLDGREG